MRTRKHAVLSEDGSYRYRLSRTWASPGPPCAFIGANPSTADATADDPTVRKMTALAKLWGCSALQVVNVAAYRATDPRHLAGVDDPIGPDNDAHLLAVTRDVHARGGPVVAAWGTVAPTAAAAHAARLLAGAGRAPAGAAHHQARAPGTSAVRTLQHHPHPMATPKRAVNAPGPRWQALYDNSTRSTTTPGRTTSRGPGLASPYVSRTPAPASVPKTPGTRA